MHRPVGGGAGRTEKGLVPSAHLDRGRAVPRPPGTDVRRAPARLDGHGLMLVHVGECAERDGNRDQKDGARHPSEPPAGSRDQRQPLTGNAHAGRTSMRACVWDGSAALTS